ncbi:hypothetical protein [Saccharopolyspora gloriosae]|uniref:hypothetical protein n=1 Tax=Saccharopolyspora gloriosae TaxID=455344 RepID=UPI001FB584DB|nr:hypothetical protein [Saccharopolyspora gloriosae]
MRTRPRTSALLLLLAGTGVIVGDLFVQHGRPDWYVVGLGALFLGLMSASDQLSQHESVSSAAPRRPVPTGLNAGHRCDVQPEREISVNAGAGRH